MQKEERWNGTKEDINKMNKDETKRNKWEISGENNGVVLSERLLQNRLRWKPLNMEC